MINNYNRFMLYSQVIEEERINLDGSADVIQDD